MNSPLAELIRNVARYDPANPDLAWEAAIALGESTLDAATDRTAAIEALMVALRPTSYALTRAHAAEALGKIGDPRSVQSLIGALDDDYYLTRSYAAAALGNLGSELAVEPMLRRLAGESYFGVRASLVAALGQICAGRESTMCQQAREALLAQRLKEESSADERSQRVVREINRALGQAGAIDDQTGATRVIAEVERAIDRMGGSTDE